MAQVNSNSFAVEVVAAETTYLGQQAEELSPGSYTTLSMTGLNWSLIEAPDGSGGVLEYANQGIYDPVRKQIRYVGIEDKAPTSGQGTKFLVYSLTTNTWTTGTAPFTDNASHSWCGNAVEPASGDGYIACARGNFSGYGSHNTRKWNGSAWSDIAAQPHSGTTSLIMALAWDENRGGMFAWDDDQGLLFWTKGAGSWASLGEPSGVDGQYHHWAGFSRSSGNVMLTNGANGTTTRFWLYTTGNAFSAAKTAPTSLNTCGSGGKLLTYDYRTSKFLVFDPTGSNMWEYNDVSDSWTGPTSRVPINQTYDAGNVQCIVVPISDFGGVVLILAYRGVGAAPVALLYKHG